MRWLVAALIVVGIGCASAVMWVTPQPILDEYATARVRIYHMGKECRLEVITPTHTVVTLQTRCLIVPHRVTP